MNRYRQNFENYTKKDVKRYTSPCNHKGDTGYLNSPYLKIYTYI